MSRLVDSHRLSLFVVVYHPSCRRNSVPMEKVAKGVIFGGFKFDVASFRVAGVALCDTWTCLVTGRKSFLRGRRNTLDVSIFIFRGMRSTSDVSCCVFFANRIGRAKRSGDKVQIPW